MKQYLLILLATLGLGVFTVLNTDATSANIFPSDSNVSSSSDAIIEPVETTFLDSISVSELVQPEELNLTELENTAVLTSYASTSYSSYTYTSSVINYNVTARNTITSDPGNTINKTAKAVWGHNDPGLLLSAHSMTPGSIFTVTEENGTVATYVVSSTRIYAVSELQEMVSKRRNRMYEVAYEAKDDSGNYHDLVLFTCYEQSRQAAHRFVVFADAI